MNQLLSRFLDWVDDFLDNTKETLSETTRITAGKLKRLEIHRRGGDDGALQRRWRIVPLQYLTHPLFNTLMCGVLFLGLTVSGIAADDTQAVWTLWLPLPLLSLLILTGWFDFRVVRNGPALGMVSALVLTAIGVRHWVAMKSPIPHVGTREVMDFFVAFATGAAVWVTAGRQTIGVYAVWLAGLAVIFLSRIGLTESKVLFRPDQLPLIISLLWGFASFGGALSHRFDPPAKRRAGSGAVIPAHFLASAFGVVLGIICYYYYRTTPEATMRDQAGALQRGQEATGLLWAKSFLFGWGRDVLRRLEEVTAEPMTVAFPEWQGIIGTLGSYGMVFLVFGGLASLALMWSASRRARLYGLSLSSAPQLALLAAQAFMALILTGCPRSSLPWIVLAGWLGLGLASGSYAKLSPDPTETFEDEESYSQIGMLIRLGCVGAVIAVLVAGCVTALRPTLARHWTTRVTVEALHDDGLGARLNRARILAPWDPQVEIKEGMRLREALQATPVENWDESLFQEACDAYTRAHRLDPFDPLITLHHAKLLDLAERPEQAQRAVLMALEETPSSETLVEWLYLQTSRRKNDEVALAMIKEGVRLAPKEGKWWLRLYSTEALVGHGPRASRALGTALTAEPENKLIVQAARGRAELPE